jgi:hypothetical protein
MVGRPSGRAPSGLHSCQARLRSRIRRAPSPPPPPPPQPDHRPARASLAFAHAAHGAAPPVLCRPPTHGAVRSSPCSALQASHSTRCCPGEVSADMFTCMAEVPTEYQAAMVSLGSLCHPHDGHDGLMWLLLIPRDGHTTTSTATTGASRPLGPELHDFVMTLPGGFQAQSGYCLSSPVGRGCFIWPNGPHGRWQVPLSAFGHGRSAAHGHWRLLRPLMLGPGAAARAGAMLLRLARRASGAAAAGPSAGCRLPRRWQRLGAGAMMAVARSPPGRRAAPAMARRLGMAPRVTSGKPLAH